MKPSYEGLYFQLKKTVCCSKLLICHRLQQCKASRNLFQIHLKSTPDDLINEILSDFDDFFFYFVLMKMETKSISLLVSKQINKSWFCLCGQSFSFEILHNKKCKNLTKNHIICVKHKENYCKKVKMHKFLFFAYKSKIKTKIVSSLLKTKYMLVRVIGGIFFFAKSD